MKQFHLFFILFFSAFSSNARALNETDTIINRHKSYLLQTNTVSREVAEKIIGLFDEKTARWANIDYTDNTPADWPAKDHLGNVKALAIYFVQYPESAEGKKILPVLIRALDEWHKHKFKNTNWWHNEIGVPQLMRDILVLIEEDLSENRLKNYLEIVNQFKINGTGANLTWSSDIGMFYGLFTQNDELVDKTVRLIVNEIRISDKEGLKPDYSFHQHDERLQMYQYGRVFLIDNIRLAWELLNTQWAFPKEKIDLLAGMFLNGWQWMARGINTIPETMDRSATRVNALMEADIRNHFPFFIEVAPQYKTQLLAAKANQEDGKYTLAGFRGFPYSDIVTYHNPAYSFFLKTISSRTLPTESINYENLKGKLLNSGETYFIRDGDEYFNLMPVWDWEKLPGITAFAGADKISRNEFNGIVTDGAIGVNSMNYKMMGKDTNTFISCKKSWFILDGYMVCLMSDIKMKNLDSAYTVLDQSRLQGIVRTDRGKLKGGHFPASKIKWILHNNFTYMPLYTGTQTELYTDTADGSWHSINQSYSKDIIIEKVFMPSVLHRVNNTKSGYAVFYTENPKEARRLSNKMPFRILKNESGCQALLSNDNTLLAVFYKGGELLFSQNTILADNACMLIVRNGSIFASDPMHRGVSLKIFYNDKAYTITLPADGSTVKIN